MTNLEALAKDPQAFDTELARLHTELDDARRTQGSLFDTLHRLAGDRKRWMGNSTRWTMDATEVEALARFSSDAKATEAIRQLDATKVKLAELRDSIVAMDRAYTGWTRFFPSVTKSQPHIHRDLHCRTLYPTTVMSWAPGLSGKSDEEAVAELDEALCSVCFPDAPVKLREYVSRKSQAEQAERQAAKDERAAKLAAKQLTEAEQFRTTGKYGERVETVAKCLELVRQAVELEVEVEFWTTHSPAGWDAEHLANRRRNVADSLSEARVDAAEAERVLLAREARHEGWGATADQIAKIRASKLKSARKEWGL